jgi:hypothetical protein
MNFASVLKNTIHNLTNNTSTVDTVSNKETTVEETTIEETTIKETDNIQKIINNPDVKPFPSLWNLGRTERLLDFLSGQPVYNTFSGLFKSNKVSNYKYTQIYINSEIPAELDKRLTIKFPEHNEVDIVQNPVILLEGSAIKSLAKIYSKYPNGIRELTSKIIKSCELEIGGQRISKLYNIGFDFFSKKNNYQMYQYVNQKYAMTTGKLYIPIPFDLLINEGFLPIMLIKYHSVKIKLDLESVTNLTKGNTELMSKINYKVNCQLKLDAIYLPSDSYNINSAREFFFNNYQYTGPELVNKKEIVNNFTLNFNNGINGIFICFTHGKYNEIVRNDYIFDNLKLVIEGNVLLNMSYEMLKSEGLYHAGMKNDSETDGYFWIPFSRINEAINNNIQTRGTINMTILNNVKVEIQFNENINKYEELYFNAIGTNFDIIRIMSGMAGIAFSK